MLKYSIEKDVNAMAKQRITPHYIETQSRDIIRLKINKAHEGNFLYREISERDYGIDGLIELFNDGNVTGMFALAQIKGRNEKITPLKKTPQYISCNISVSNACYALQDIIPVILFYVSIKEPECIYYTNIQNSFDNEQKAKLSSGQKSINIKIPVENIVDKEMENILKLIQGYYK